MSQVGVGHAERDFQLARGLHQVFGLLEIEAERLFAEHGDASLHGLHGRVVMHEVGRHDEDVVQLLVRGQGSVGGTAPNLAVLIAAQIFFGGAIGLIYYSSLFYSIDSDDSKGEHGGIHEAVIGLGNCLGPATGAAALWLAPGHANIGAWAVSGLLLLGLGGLFGMRGFRRR